MTAIVDKKALGFSKPEGACSLSMPGANGRRCLVNCRQKPQLIQKREGWRTPRRFAKFQCPFDSATAFGLRFRNYGVALDSLPLARATTQCGTGFQSRR